MDNYNDLTIENVTMDYRELRAIVNKTHDRFSELNFDQSLSLPQKVNLLAEHFKVVLKDFQKVVDYLDYFIENFDDKLYKTLNDVLKEWLVSGELGELIRDIVNEEVITARTSYNGNNYDNLKSRLDSEEKENVNRFENNSNEIKNIRNELQNIQNGFLGFFSSEQELKNTYPTGEKGFAIVFDNDKPFFYSYVGDKWVKGEEFSQPNYNFNFKGENLVKNGDFSNGLTGGWTSSFSTQETNNNILTNIADGSQSYATIQQVLNSVTTGNKYYLGFMVKSNNSEIKSVGIRLNNSTPSYKQLENISKGVEYHLSGIFEFNTGTPALQITHFYENNIISKDKSIDVSYVFALDLTKTFGKGYEPDLKMVDVIMSYYKKYFFNGVVPTLVDNPALFRLVNDVTGGLAKRTLLGTKNQVNVLNGSGVDGNPIISIPKNPQMLLPEIASAKLGSNIAPSIQSWKGNDGAIFEDNLWKIIPKSSIETTIDMVKDKEYEITILWNTTDDYTVNDIPRLIVSLNGINTVGQFTGYSDALYKLSLKANETGSLLLKLGDTTENWSATIKDVIVLEVIEKVTSSYKIGYGRMNVLTTGDNLFIGDGGNKLVSGLANNSYGFRALEEITVGRYNLAMGTYAGEKIDTGMNNVALGHASLRYLQSGYYNIGIGYSAMLRNINGNWNIAIGNECLRDLVDGIRNTVVGSRAMNDTKHGSRNTVMGREAGLYPDARSNPTINGSDNVFIGYRSGEDNQNDGDFGVAIGSQATTVKYAVSVGAKTQAKELGSVALGIDSLGNGARATKVNQIAIGTELQTIEIQGQLALKEHNKDLNKDTLGSISYDDEHLYITTSKGVKKVKLELL